MSSPACRPFPCCSKGVVLVNPATSFSRTVWAKLGPYLTRLPAPLYTLSMLPIGMLLLDGGQVGPSMRQRAGGAMRPFRECRCPQWDLILSR